MIKIKIGFNLKTKIMNAQEWFNEQNIEAVQDRRDGFDYWKNNNLYTETDILEIINALINK